MLRVALCQMAVVADKKVNWETAERMIREAVSRKATTVVLPEIWNSPYGVHHFAGAAEALDHQDSGSRTLLSRLAKELEITLVGGSIPELFEGRLYNTAMVMGPDGSLIATHRKMHLFDVNVQGGICFRESDALSAGDAVTTFPIASHEITAGLGICYDIRFPELSSLMTQRGAGVLFFPSAFNMTTGPLHWTLLARARAVDNQAFTVLCSPARDSEGGGYVAWGHSLICDPWGRIVGELDEKPGLLVCDLDLSMIEQFRAQIPVLKQKRQDVYELIDKRK